MKQNTKVPRRIWLSVPASILAVSLSLSGCRMQIRNERQAPNQPAGTEASLDTKETASASQPQEETFENQADQEFDHMTEELYASLVTADYLTERQFYRQPEAVRPLGEDGIQLAVCEPALPDLSETAWDQQLETVKSLKFQLGITDRSQLSGDRQGLYDLLSFYADAELKKEGLSAFRLLHALSPDQGLMLQIPKRLHSLPLCSRQDAEDYLALLDDLPRLFKDLTDLCREGSEKGLHFTEQWLKDASSACAPYCLTPEHNSLVVSFPDRLDQIPDLTAEERSDYIRRNQEVVSQKVIPAYQKLSQDILDLPIQTLEYEGLCDQTGGRSYYRYLVARNSGTSCQDIRQLKNAIEDQLNQNTQTLNKLLEDFPMKDQRTFAFPSVSEDPDETLRFLKQETDKHFPAFPSKETARDMELTVLAVPLETEDLWELPSAERTAFDSRGTSEMSSARQLFLSQSTAGNPEHLYAALSQFGFPGQAYREYYTMQQEQTKLLTVLSFPGWERGWDLYGRIFAISFDNGLTPETRQMARLSLSSSRAVRALIDIQVNYYGWGLDEVREYLASQYHSQEEEIAKALYRKSLYAPADSVIEYAGYLEIRQIKAQAQTELGEAFDETAFHRFLLDEGPAPFGLIRSHLKQWILEQNLSNIRK